MQVCVCAYVCVCEYGYLCVVCVCVYVYVYVCVRGVEWELRLCVPKRTCKYWHVYLRVCLCVRACVCASV